MGWWKTNTYRIAFRDTCSRQKKSCSGQSSNNNNNKVILLSLLLSSTANQLKIFDDGYSYVFRQPSPFFPSITNWHNQLDSRFSYPFREFLTMRWLYGNHCAIQPRKRTNRQSSLKCWPAHADEIKQQQQSSMKCVYSELIRMDAFIYGILHYVFLTGGFDRFVFMYSLPDLLLAWKIRLLKWQPNTVQQVQ